MSDFSELCPLFNTGVYHELTLPEAMIGGRSVSGGIHMGFCFSRKVVVTNAYAIKVITSTWTASTVFNLLHATTLSIAADDSMTVVATWLLTTSGIGTRTFAIGRFVTGAMTTTTFEATDIIATAVETDVGNMGRIALVIRYRDA